MVINFLKKNINIISLVLVLLCIISIKYLWIFGALLVILILPLIICITIADAIINPNSNILNFMALLVCVYIYESAFIRQDIPLYFIWLAILLFILIIFNVLKKNSVFKYSTALILCLTLVFHIVVQHSGSSSFNKDIFNKVGYQGRVCLGSHNCKEYKIPRKYNELKFIISGDFCPVFRAVKNGNVIFINQLNKNLFPDAQSVEYIGNGGSQGNLLFKVKEKNGKFGLYSFDAKMCHEYESFQATKRVEKKYNAITELIPPKYDDMEIIKENKHYYNDVEFRDMYIVPLANAPIITIICKHGNLYDIYKSTNKLTNKNSQYELHLKNQKNVKYMGKNNNTIYPEEYKFEIDGKTTNQEFNKVLKYGDYECIKDGKICHYKLYEGSGRQSGDGCPEYPKRKDFLLSKYCKFTPTKVRKYECMLDIGRVIVYIEDGRVISAMGNGLGGRDIQSYYKPDKCKPVEMIFVE